MKKILVFILCAFMVLSFAACGEKEVSNGEISGTNGGASGSTSDDSYVEDDQALLDIQDIIGFWFPESIYQAPRATDGQFDSDEDALLYAQGNPVQISANEFSSPLYYTDNAVFKRTVTTLDELGEYGIQVDDTLTSLVGDGEIVRMDIFEGEDSAPSFQVFIINGTTMLYEGESGYIFLASLEASVG